MTGRSASSGWAVAAADGVMVLGVLVMVEEVSKATPFRRPMRRFPPPTPLPAKDAAGGTVSGAPG
uniref:Uncharacterized protein n=1 Tax=Kitasatospora sp. CMC57 TaxID=3231513 RepID=A0AB33JRE0_9ACTN